MQKYAKSDAKNASRCFISDDYQVN